MFYVCKNRNNSECWLSSKEQLFSGRPWKCRCALTMAPEKGPSLHLPAPQFLSLVVLSSGQSTSRQHWGGFCPVSWGLERSGWVLTINSVLKSTELLERKLSGDQKWPHSPLREKAVSRVPEQSENCRSRHHPAQDGFHFHLCFPLCLFWGALLIFVYSTQNNADVKMEKWGWLFFQIGELKVPAVAQPFFLVRLDAETMAKALECSSQWQNQEAHVPRGETAHTSSSANFPAFNRSGSNCLMSLCTVG